MKLVVGQDDLISHPIELVDELGGGKQKLNKEGKGKGFSLSSFFVFLLFPLEVRKALGVSGAGTQTCSTQRWSDIWLVSELQSFTKCSFWS